jgi:hypothetical protein
MMIRRSCALSKILKRYENMSGARSVLYPAEIRLSLGVPPVQVRKTNGIAGISSESVRNRSELIRNDSELVRFIRNTFGENIGASSDQTEKERM